MSDNSGLIVSALEQTDPSLAQAIDARNSWKAAVKERAARVALYRNYERGDHRANMTVQMKKMLRLIEDDSGLSELNVNYCKVIVDKMAGRVFVSNIDTDTDAANDWLKETLERNDFDAQQIEWFRGAIRDGDAYVMVDPETAAWTSESAYDGHSGMVVIYGNKTRKPIWACKLWSEANIQDKDSDTSKMMVVVYQPFRVTYWSGQVGSSDVQPEMIAPIPFRELDPFIRQNIVTQPVEDIPVTNEREWPLKSGRMPFVNIANQKDNYTSYGESELRPAIPLQDSLNAIQHDKIMASKLTAFNIYWSIGFNIDVDGILPGAVINLSLRDKEDNVIISPNEDQIEFLKAARVGQFTGADITQYTNQVEKEVMQISQVTQTPIYGVTADGNLSGEALKQLEIGLIGKIERFQHQNADAIKELIALTAEIQSAFDGLQNAPTFGSVKVIWKSPELLDVNARIQTLVTLREKAPGLFTDEFFIRRVGTLLGMSQEDINGEIEKAANQRGFMLDAFTGAGLVGAGQTIV